MHKPLLAALMVAVTAFPVYAKAQEATFSTLTVTDTLVASTTETDTLIADLIQGAQVVTTLIQATTGSFDALVSTLATITTAVIGSLTADTAVITDATFENATSTNLSVENLTADKIVSALVETDSLVLTHALSLLNGGTGASTAAGARANLGLSYARNGEVGTTSVTIATWGDSLTQGSGGIPYQTTLSALSGYSTYNGGVGGQNSSSIKARMLAATDKHSWPTIIWAGRVSVLNTTQTKADIAEMVAALPHDNYLVIGVTNGDIQSEYAGNSTHALINQLNQDLAATYGTHFVDVRPYLVSLYDPNIAQDVIDHGRDIPPSSLRVDAIHFNSAGYQRIAEKIYQQIGVLIDEDVKAQKVITTENLGFSFANPAPIGSLTPNTGRFSAFRAGTVGSLVNTFTAGENIARTTFTGAAPGTALLLNAAGTNQFTTLDFGNVQAGNGLPESRIGSVRTTTGSFLYFGTSNSYNSGITNTAMVIDPSGQVGIGTQSPLFKLHVVGNTRVQNTPGSPAYLDMGTTDNKNAYLRYFTGNISRFVIGVDAADGHKFKIGTGNDFSTTRLAIDSVGNVGIGTGNPQSSLAFSAARSWSGITLNQATDEVTNYSRGVIFMNNGNISIRGQAAGTGQPVGIQLLTSSSVGSLYLDPTGLGGALGYFQIAGGGGTPNRYGVHLGAGDHYAGAGYQIPVAILSSFTQTGTASFTAFRIRPTIKSVGAGPNYLMEVGTAAVPHSLVVTAGGNVGIATSTPSHAFSVAGTVGFSGLTGATGAGSLCLSAGGEVVFNSGSDNCLPSLQSFKRERTDLAISGRKAIDALKPVSFIYTSDTTERVRYGFMAEEARVVNEHLVTYDAQGKPSGLDTPGFLALIVRALQEMKETVETGLLKTHQVKTDVLCVGQTCITEAELKRLLEAQSVSAISVPAPVVEESAIVETPVVEVPVVEEPAPVEAPL